MALERPVHGGSRRAEDKGHPCLSVYTDFQETHTNLWSGTAHGLAVVTGRPSRRYARVSKHQACTVHMRSPPCSDTSQRAMPPT